MLRPSPTGAVDTNIHVDVLEFGDAAAKRIIDLLEIDFGLLQRTAAVLVLDNVAGLGSQHTNVADFPAQRTRSIRCV
jgi:hypothetical protein